MSPPSGRTAVLAGLLATAAVVAGAASATGGAAHAPTVSESDLQARRIASASRGGLTDSALAAAFADMEPGARALAASYAPAPAAKPAMLSGAGPVVPEGAQFSERALQNLPLETARLVNASIPFSNEANPPARPFRLVASADDRQRALKCLAEAVYYEAGFEPVEGQRAVAQVVINRLRHPIYPKTVCGVVYQGAELATGCQFTFACDGSLARPPSEAAWRQARKVAEEALNGRVAKDVGEATHYHADYVVPYWLPSLFKVAKVGAHIFYRWPGGMGLPAAFSGRYAGAEPPTKTQPAAPIQLASATASTSAQGAAQAGPAAPAALQLAAAAPVPAGPIEIATAAAPSLRLDPPAEAVQPKPKSVWIPPGPGQGSCGSGFAPCRGF